MQSKDIARLRLAIPFLVASLTWTIASCGDSNNQQGGTAGNNFTGRYVGSSQGIEGGIRFNTILTVALNQNEERISGTYANDQGGGGSLNGSANGNSVTFTGAGQDGCAFSGEATLSDGRLRGGTSRPERVGCPSLSQTFDLVKTSS